MNLLMVSGDRQVAVGERGPFWQMQREFSTYFDRVDVLLPPQPDEPSVLRIHGNVHLHPAASRGAGLAAWIEKTGEELARTTARPGVIVSHDYGRFYNGRGASRLARRLGVAHVSELHHVPGHPVAANGRERLEKLLARTWVRWAKSRVAAFRVVNETEMPELLRSWGVHADKICVLPSQYLDFSVFHPPRAPEPIQRDLVFAGRMVANKRVDRILEALGSLRRRGTKLSALFIGKGPLKPKLVARASTLGLDDQVEWVDWVAEPEELASLYRTSRVCVCASTSEGGPRFTVEAMACGTPVVSTPVGVMTDLLSDGAAGKLCGFDVPSLVTALLDVVTHEGRRRERGMEAFRRVQAFEYSVALERYARGLIEIAGSYDREAAQRPSKGSVR